MERGNTKQEILDAALELFSVQGFEATSIAQIAGTVGIRKASLYSHFENKQAILDALVQEVLEQYEEHSLFARTDWENDAGRLPSLMQPKEQGTSSRPPRQIFTLMFWQKRIRKRQMCFPAH